METLATERSEEHKKSVEDWKEGEIETVWFDHDGNLCIEYTSGS